MTTDRERIEWMENRIESLEAGLTAVVTLHSQRGDGGLAEGAWCPTDGDRHPCRTLRAALDGNS